METEASIRDMKVSLKVTRYVRQHKVLSADGDGKDDNENDEADYNDHEDDGDDELVLVFQEALLEVEERYRRAMVSNAQLHNNKSTLMYQVEALKDELSDLEELLWEMRRHCEKLDKVRRARFGHLLQDDMS